MSEIRSRPQATRTVFWVAVLLLVLGQQWPGFWSTEALVFGFLPAPLFYHVVVSLAAVVVLWIGTVVAWPDDTLDAMDSGGELGGDPSANDPSTTGGVA